MQDTNNLPERTQNCRIGEIRLTNLEEGQKNMIRELECIGKEVNNQNELMTKIDTMMNFVIEDRKEQREINKKTSDTLDKINDNLTGLNKDVGNLEQRFSVIEKTQEENRNKYSFDVVELFVQNFKYVVGLGIAGAIIYIATQVLPTLVK